MASKPTKKRLAQGRKLARSLPAPKVTQHAGVNVVTQQVEGLSPAELAALSDYYLDTYGEGCDTNPIKDWGFGG